MCNKAQCAPRVEVGWSFHCVPGKFGDMSCGRLGLVPGVRMERGCYVGQAKGRNRSWRDVRVVRPNDGFAAVADGRGLASTGCSRPGAAGGGK